jgi:hypothetical protein
MPPQPTLLLATIQAGQSLSEAVDCSVTNKLISGLITPMEWTPANLTFLTSPDGVTYYDLRESNGMEVTMPVITGSIVPFMRFRDYVNNAAFIKFRSGSKHFPVPQAASRSFTLELSDYPPTVTALPA